jgi:hypothetical protein
VSVERFPIVQLRRRTVPRRRRSGRRAAVRTVVEDVKLFFVVTDAQEAKKPEAVFLVMCDPSMNEL